MLQIQKRTAKWRQCFLKNGLQKSFFISFFFVAKRLKFCTIWTIRFGSNPPACGPNAYQIIYGENLDSQCHLLQWYHGRVFMANLLQKLVFWVGILCYHYWRWHWKSLHTLFDKYLDHMLVKFELNLIVWYMKSLSLFGKKSLTIFEKVFTPFWKTFLWLKKMLDAKI